MISMIALLLAAVAAAQASFIAPGLLSPIGAIPTAVRTGSIVAIPGATSVDNRVIASNGLVSTTAVKTGSVVSHLASGLVGAPLLNTGLLGAPIIGNGLIGAPLLNSGLIGAPILGKGLVGAPLLNTGLIGTTSSGSVVSIPGATSVDSRMIATNGIVGITKTAKTGSVISIPGATTIDSRIIGTPGILRSPMLNKGLLGAPMIGTGLIGSPIAINSGLIAPGLLGLKTIM